MDHGVVIKTAKLNDEYQHLHLEFTCFTT